MTNMKYATASLDCVSHRCTCKAMGLDPGFIKTHFFLSMLTIPEEEKAMVKVDRAMKQMQMCLMVIVGILDFLIGVHFNVKVVVIRFWD